MKLLGRAWRDSCVALVLFFLAQALPALGVLLLLAAATASSAADVKHVVLVSVDGLAASYLDDPQADMPTLRRLRKLGARPTA